MGMWLKPFAVRLVEYARGGQDLYVLAIKGDE
jgi:hypothetical protein